MSFRTRALGLSLLASVTAFSGCAAEDGDEEAARASGQAIMGGYADPGDKAVVGIVWIEGQYVSMCTGSLIAPNLVLTARHCVANITGMVGGGVDCTKSKFTAPDGVANFGVTTEQFMPWDQAKYHAVKEIIVPTDPLVCGNDVAMMVLAENVDPSEAAPLIPRVDTKSAKNDDYSAIGYGNTNDTSGGGQRRRRDDLVIDCITSCPSDYLVINREWLGDTGICQGDSGGPAVDAEGRVIGVTSRGQSGCTFPVYGYVFGWADWIKETALHAADVGGYPPAGWAKGFSSDPIFNFPVGDACTDGAGCPSGACVTDDNGSYCSRACSDVGPCPDGYTCAQIGDQQLCQKPPPVIPEETPDAGDGNGGEAPSTSEKSGCSISDTDPTKPVPWSTGVAVAAAGLALLRRRRRGTSVDR